jgi:hypothetical protein
VKTLLGDFNAKVGNFKTTFGNESLHEISNDYGVRVVNFVTSENLSRVQCSHICTFINTLGLLMMGKHNQNDNVSIYIKAFKYI